MNLKEIIEPLLQILTCSVRKYVKVKCANQIISSTIRCGLWRNDNMSWNNFKQIKQTQLFPQFIIFQY